MSNRDNNKTSQPIGFGGGRGFMAGGGKAKNFKQTIGELFVYLRPYWLQLGIVVVAAIGSAVFMVVGPKLLGDMTNLVVAGIQPGTSGIDYVAMGRLALLLFGLYGLSAAFAYTQGWIMAGVVQRVTYRFRQEIAHKITKLPLSYFDKQPYGDILSRVTNDVDTVGQSLNQSLTQIITSVVMVVGVITMMFSISWQLTLISILVIPLTAVATLFIVKRSQRYFRGQQATLGELNGHIEEMLSGHMVMRAFNGEVRSIEKFDEHNTKLYGNAWRAQFLSGLLMPITQFIGSLGFVAVAVGGGWLAAQGAISIGGIQAFLQYINQLNQPVTQVANVANVLQQAAAAAERVFEFLAETDELPTLKPVPSPRRVKGAVEFKNVSFGYEPERTIINNLSISVRPGQRVAIVGPTGAGKTTLVNLLMRFYDPQSGSITVDGIDVHSLRRPDVRQLFGMVLQDTWLFNGSISENIAYGSTKSTPEAIALAATAAHADELIHALPGGYKFELTENADNIAQGEKQLITIARAMLTDPPILILDEATSSVDTRTEVLIQKAMEKLMKNRTSFVIAHRLSTIRDADLILVMREGSIVESGTHDSLMAANGDYASLYTSQFSGA